MSRRRTARRTGASWPLDRLAVAILGGGMAALVGYRLVRYGMPAGWGAEAAVYYGLPALAFGVALLASLASHGIRRGLIAAAVSVLAGAFCAEVALDWQARQAQRLRAEADWRVAENFDAYRWAAKRAGKQLDMRPRTTILDGMRAAGQDVLPYSNPLDVLALHQRTPDQWRSTLTLGGGEVLPLASIPAQTMLGCTEDGEYPLYRSDEYGFNNPAGLWSEGPVDAVTLGDSFTFGACVPTGKDIAGQMRASVPKTVNLGIPSMGPLAQLGILAEYAPLLRPRVIYWVIYEGNDFRDLVRELATPVLRRYLEEPGFSQNLAQRKDEVRAAFVAWVAQQEARHRKIQEASRLRHLEQAEAVNLSDRLRLKSVRALLFAALGQDRPAEAAGAADPLNGETLERIFQRGKSIAEGFGGRIVVVYLPHKNRYCSDWFDGSMWVACRVAQMRTNMDHSRPVREIAERQGLGFVDFNDHLGAHPDPARYFAYPGSHYNAEGYGAVARELVGQAGQGAR